MIVKWLRFREATHAIIFPRIMYFDVPNFSTLVVVIIKFRVLWCLDFTSEGRQVACCKAPFFIYRIYIFTISSSSLLINLSTTPGCVEKNGCASIRHLFLFGISVCPSGGLLDTRFVKTLGGSSMQENGNRDERAARHR